MRFRLAFIRPFLSTVLFVFGCIVILGQTASTLEKDANPADPEGILRQLAPDDAPPKSLTLKPAEKARAIRLLVAVKRDETGWHRQLAIYLLASLGYDYEHNREELLQVWQGCVINDFDHGCDENTALALVELYEQGHRELLHLLLAGCLYSDGALSEELFPFYAERLNRNPREFIAALAPFSPIEQQHICEKAGGELCEEAGGGPADGTYPSTMRKVLHHMQEIGGETAGQCSRAVKQGYREMVTAILEEEKGPKTEQK